jgi:hypothetical protein
MLMKALSKAVVLVLVAGCGSTGVLWEEPRSAPGDTLGALILGGEGTVGFGRLAASAMPADSLRCDGSFVIASEGPRTYAAWLRRRADSTVVVVAARRDGGNAWTTPATVDSVDVGKFGCSRPPPSIAVADGYVHVSYSLKAPEGFGVFFAHSMDQAATFHSPMTVIYGDRLSVTAIAAHGMRVAIAYEDPSGSRRRIGVAISKTQGHTFEPREVGSPDEMPATRPRIAIRDSMIALSFGGADGVGRAVRLGVLR